MSSTDSTSHTWLFLRGLVREKRHWEGFPDLFSQVFPGDRIVYHEYPGNGIRYREASLATVPDMVDDAIHSLTQKGVLRPGQPVYLQALSLGGMVAVD